jgi:hypothetical protein
MCALVTISEFYQDYGFVKQALIRVYGNFSDTSLNLLSNSFYLNLSICQYYLLNLEKRRKGMQIHSLYWQRRLSGAHSKVRIKSQI